MSTTIDMTLEPDELVTILCPRDWHRVKTSSFTVVVAGLRSGPYACCIWRQEDFFSRSSAILASAELREHHSGVWTAYFERIEAWNVCVIGVVCNTTNKVLACSGVHLGLSSETRLLRKVSMSRRRTDHISYPLPLTYNEISNIRTGDLITPCRIVSKTEFQSAKSAATSGGTIFQILAEEEHHDARPSMMLDYCVGVGEACFDKYYEQWAWSSARHYAAMLFEADLYVGPGLPIVNDGIWGDAAYAGLAHDPVLGHYPEMFRFNGAIGRVDGGCFVRLDDSRTAFMLGNAGFGNIAHWIMNSLMAAYVMRDAIIEQDMILVSPVLPSYARESLRLLGLSDRLHETTELQLAFEKLIYTSYLSTHYNMMPSTQAKAMIQYLRGAANRDPAYDGIEAPELLFFSRRGAPSSRNFCNELEFASELRQIGFKEVATHDLGFVEKIRVVSKARIIVAQLGAALSHIAFAPEGCVIVEITTKSFHSNEYWYLAHLLGQRFVRIIGNERPSSIDWKNFDFDIDIDAAMKQIIRLLKKPEAES